LAVGCTPATPTLRHIDAAAFTSAVTDAARQLGVPGALVLAVTPHGRFVASAGTTELGEQLPPAVDTRFRIASNTKTYNNTN